jgi:AcrR family transcriptional regulator
MLRSGSMEVSMINNTNDKIRYTAFKLFLERGYEASNIRDICNKVDIKAASLYFYYKSKQELFFSIYDEIWTEEINFIQGIYELKQDISPDMKLYYLFRKTIDYHIHDIVKYKFLLRYHLFPPEEIATIIREKFKCWTNQENKIILDILNECFDKKLLDDNRNINDYLQDFRKFLSLQLTDMIISNIRLSGLELDNLWNRFWNCTMLNGQ